MGLWSDVADTSAEIATVVADCLARAFEDLSRCPQRRGWRSPHSYVGFAERAAQSARCSSAGIA